MKHKTQKAYEASNEARSLSKNLWFITTKTLIFKLGKFFNTFVAAATKALKSIYRSMWLPYLKYSLNMSYILVVRV